MKVLLVDDDKELLSYMKTIVDRQGHEVCTAGNGLLGLEAFDKFYPDVVISDIQMPQKDGLSLLAEIRKRNKDTIVIMVTGAGSELSAIEALRLGANNYLRKPVNRKEVRSLLYKYEIVVGERAIDQEILNFIVTQNLTMTIDNRVRLSTRVANFLARQASGIIDDASLDITLGLDELLLNAIEHGNLEISYEEKENALAEPHGLNTLYAERIDNPELNKRRVYIEFNADQDGKCEWIIRDDGNGFDWTTIPNPLEEDNLVNPSGRGIFLSQLAFDELDYLEKGNIVRAVKYGRKRSSI